MPRGGHNRKPTVLKVIQGNPGKRALNKNEPKPRPIAPEPPPGLDRFGREAWRRLAPLLERQGLLTEDDAELFWAFCQTWSQLRKAVRELNKMNPRDEDYRKVAVTVENARKDLRLLAVEFGLTPAARSRIDLPQAEDEADGALERLWTTR
nr:MAG: phage terminase small subunit P27 family [Sphaerobacter thermophilus]